MLTVYSKPNCPQCDRLKAKLNGLDIPYQVIDVAADAVARTFLVGAGHKSVPQMYLNGKHLKEEDL